MMNIYQKIAAVMQDVQYLAKDDSVEFNKTKYKAITEEKVTSTLRRALLEHGLVVFPVEQHRERVGAITSVDVKYRLQNIENPEDYIIVVSSGDGADTQDKGAGKAMTYAFKYMFLRTFAIPTGEDPDKISSDELDAKQAAEAAKRAEEQGTSPITAEQWNMLIALYEKAHSKKPTKAALTELIGMDYDAAKCMPVREWDFAMQKLGRVMAREAGI